MNQLADIQLISIRGRIAYFLYIIENIFDEIEDNTNGSLQARASLNKCWEWLSGKSLVLGNDLYYLLENEDDTGLLVYGSEVDEGDVSKFSTWGVIIYTLMYVIWHSYRLQHEIYVPQTIENVDETIIDDINQYLEQVPSVDKKYNFKLRTRLIQEFPFDSENEFGSFISKDQIFC